MLAFIPIFVSYHASRVGGGLVGFAKLSITHPSLAGVLAEICKNGVHKESWGTKNLIKVFIIIHIAIIISVGERVK